MNKNRLLVLGLTCLLLGGVVGCSPVDPSSEEQSSSSEQSSSEVPTYDNYFKVDKTKYKTTYNGLRTSSIYTCEAKQDGDVKVLVVPVDFVGYEAERMPLGAEGTLEALDTCFFGDPNDPEDAKNLYHHSLASFYNTSSYGQCNMTGRVLPWWHTNKTPLNYLKAGGTPALVSAVQDYYLNGEGKDLINLKDYDGNNDGYVDLVHFIYTCPTGAAELEKDDNSFWAYCTSTSAFNPNPEETALISRYIFASYEFLYEGGNYSAGNGSKVAWTSTQKKNNQVKFSTHTLIHESGHGLGLPDYYSYDYNGDSPMGGLDMMDHNIGDHNAVSKSWYGWTEPYVVTGDADITIGAWETTGDCILVPIKDANWEADYTLLDEYIMLQFDTGTGVATTDAQIAYNSTGKYFNEPGVRMLHADARIGLLGPDGSFLGYSKTYKVNAGYYADLAHDNTASRTVNDNDLLEVILPSGTPNNKAVDNASLWREGDTLNDFEMNTVLPTSSFNEKFNLGFTITIEEINGSESALIKIREISSTIE